MASVVGCTHMGTTQKVISAPLNRFQMARRATDRYLWNRPIWHPLMSTFQPKLCNQTCSGITMEAKFDEMWFFLVHLKQFLPLFGKKNQKK